MKAMPAKRDVVVTDDRESCGTRTHTATSVCSASNATGRSRKRAPLGPPTCEKRSLPRGERQFGHLDVVTPGARLSGDRSSAARKPGSSTGTLHDLPRIVDKADVGVAEHGQVRRGNLSRNVIHSNAAAVTPSAAGVNHTSGVPRTRIRSWSCDTRPSGGRTQHASDTLLFEELELSIDAGAPARTSRMTRWSISPGAASTPRATSVKNGLSMFSPTRPIAGL
jgi:hypothetical protein